MPTEKANGYQSAQMCQAFIENHHSVTLIYPSRIQIKNKNLLSQSISQYYGLRVDLPTQKTFCIDFVDLVHDKLKFSEQHYVAKLASFLTSATVAIGFVKYLFLKKFNFDCIYIRSYHALTILLLLTPKAIHKKVFFELHLLPNLSVSRTPQFIKRLGAIGGVVTVTEALRQQLVRMGLSADSVISAHDAVDELSFLTDLTVSEAREKIRWPKEVFICSFIGKFHTMGMEKGIPEILEAATLLFEKYPQLFFCFVGGPEDCIERYKEQAKNLGLDLSRLIFMDKQPITEVPIYMAASDILLMPHPNNYFYATQVSPLKLFEYMLSKRPIVASKLPAIEEVLVNEKNALLGDPGVASSIANNIESLINDARLREYLAGNALDAGKKFTWKNRAKQIELFINSIINKTK